MENAPTLSSRPAAHSLGPVPTTEVRIIDGHPPGLHTELRSLGTRHRGRLLCLAGRECQRQQAVRIGASHPIGVDLELPARGIKGVPHVFAVHLAGQHGTARQ